MEAIVFNGGRTQDTKVDWVCKILLTKLNHLEQNTVYQLAIIKWRIAWAALAAG